MNVRCRNQQGCLLLILDGGEALDVHVVAKVKRQALASIDGRRDVVIDLSAVEFIDSTGLGALVSLYKAAAGAGRRANFIGVRPDVLHVMRMIRLDEIFELHPDFASAASALAAHPAGRG